MKIRAEEGFNGPSSAEDLFAESKADDDSLFAILREPLRPPSEWVPVDVTGSDWLGTPSDDDLLNETPTETQEELLREYMRHENDKGSPEYQIAMITQRVYHLTKVCMHFFHTCLDLKSRSVASCDEPQRLLHASGTRYGYSKAT